MWICLNNGFVSAVEDFNDTNLLVVRARHRKHLADNFPDREIVELDNADYRWRISISKFDFARIMHNRIMDIDYPNFKNSVEDSELADIYGEFWYIGYQSQMKAQSS